MQRTERGQTGIDFVIGAGVFFVAILFVLAFVPAMFAPFFGMGAGDALTSDRSAAYLVENALVEDPNANSLDSEAVNEFFDDCDNAQDEGAWLATALGINTENVQVTLGDSQCGPDPTDTETVSNRIVTVDGEQKTLRVVVW